jgi:hypothetical protein
MIMRERVVLRMPKAGLVTLALITLATMPAWAQRVTPPPSPADPGPPDSVSGPRSPTPPAARSARLPIQGRVTPPPSQPVERVPDLPPEARRLVANFAEQELMVRREAEVRLQQQRQTLVRQLQALQDRLARSGSLDEATAVRDEIRRIERSATSWGTSTPVEATFDRAATATNRSEGVAGRRDIRHSRRWFAGRAHLG